MIDLMFDSLMVLITLRMHREISIDAKVIIIRIVIINFILTSTYWS